MGEREIKQLYDQQRPQRVHPNFIPVITLNSASGIVAVAQGAKGPNLTISTACSSSAHALGRRSIHSTGNSGCRHYGGCGRQYHAAGLCRVLLLSGAVHKIQ